MTSNDELRKFKYQFDKHVWALLYLHDWDPDGKVYPEIHAVYETLTLALENQRAMGESASKYHVHKAYFMIKGEK